MKKFILAFLFLIVLANAEIIGDYNIIVAENGDALVTIEIQGRGTAFLPIPLDAGSPLIDGALYVKTSSGVNLSIGSTESASVVYKTSLLTGKNLSRWSFSMPLGDFDSSLITLSLPKNTNIIQTVPSGEINESSESKNIFWSVGKSQKEINVDYEFVELKPQSQGFDAIPIFFAILLIVLIILFYLYLKKGKGEQPSAEVKEEARLAVSKEKKNLMKALTENELKIVTFLINAGGSVRRSKLERESGLAKSSLASALYRLERRNILKVNKNYPAHMVELTDWFKSL